MFLLFLLLSFITMCFVFYNSLEYEFTVLKVVTFVFALVFNVIAVILGVYSGRSIGRAEGLVESGKYEIVTNEDYSIKELETFIKINGVYLKEVDE